jgi:hypothetical protein
VTGASLDEINSTDIEKNHKSKKISDLETKKRNWLGEFETWRCDGVGKERLRTKVFGKQKSLISL